MDGITTTEEEKTQTKRRPKPTKAHLRRQHTLHPQTTSASHFDRRRRKISRTFFGGAPRTTLSSCSHFTCFFSSSLSHSLFDVVLHLPYVSPSFFLFLPFPFSWQSETLPINHSGQLKPKMLHESSGWNPSFMKARACGYGYGYVTVMVMVMVTVMVMVMVMVTLQTRSFR